MEENKRQLMFNRPGEEAVRLANNIYYTYLQEDTPHLYVSLERFGKLVGESEVDKTKARLIKLFEELNEPIAVEDFSFRGKNYNWKALHFFDYRFVVEDDKVFVDIEIDEIFIDVMARLEAEPYINFQ
jgi:hypothetical protein